MVYSQYDLLLNIVVRMQVSRHMISRSKLFSFFTLILLSILACVPVLAGTYDIKQAEPFQMVEKAGASEKEITFEAFDKSFDVELSENKELLQRSELVARAVSELPTSRFYKGKLKNRPGSWARLADLNGKWSGAVYDGEELYLIDSLDNLGSDLSALPELAGSHLAVLRASDIDHQGSCATQANEGSGSFYSDIAAELRENVALATASRQLNVTVITDTEYATRISGSVSDQVMSVMNVVDGIFSAQVDLNISVQEIRELTNNGNLTSTSSGTLLDQLEDYTRSQLTNPGLIHLFTGKDLDGSTLGIAYIGAVCRTLGIGLSEAYSIIGALVTAHEIGHNLGSPHDNEADSVCEAEPNTFLMNPSINGSDQLSTCSMNQIQGVLASANCLVEPDPTPIPTATPVPTPTPEPTPTPTATPELFLNINGEPARIVSYGNNQDVSGTISVDSAGNVFEMNGNNWKAAEFAYTVTESTILEFDFRSDNQGEVIAIGFAKNVTDGSAQGFKLYGTQSNTATNQDFNNYSKDAPSLVHYQIPVGQYYIGNQQYLFFENDDDADANSNAEFSNILVYEGTITSPTATPTPSPTPTPTPTSEPTPTPVPTSEPTPSPSPTTAPEPTQVPSTNNQSSSSGSGGGGSAGWPLFLVLMGLAVARLRKPRIEG